MTGWGFWQFLMMIIQNQITPTYNQLFEEILKVKILIHQYFSCQISVACGIICRAKIKAMHYHQLQNALAIDAHMNT